MDRRTVEQLREDLEEHRDAMLFLFPRWGQKRFTVHAPDALQELWSVWDKDNKKTFAMGKTPLEAVTSARRRVNHEQCEAYKTAA